MRVRRTGLGVLLLLAWSCSNQGSFWVTIRFPDQQALDDCRGLTVFAIEPAEGSSCEALLEGAAAPADQGYTVEDRLDIDMPATEGSRPLENIGPGERLFFAQATDQQDRVFLRGCTTAKAGGRGVHAVVIELEKVPECRITRQGVEWCDGLDNDCDGDTDKDCLHCQADADCIDADSCLQGACTDGVCSTEPSPDGTDCDDGLYCTEGDQCTGGVCTGAGLDCSAEGDTCNHGVCDEEADACAKEAMADGTACEDGQYCTVEDTCQSGACTGGQTRDCSESAEECVEGLCNEDADACEGRPMQDGEPCDDGQYCTVDETCLSGVPGEPGTCQGGQQRDCSQSCVDGSCNETQDRCVGTNLDAGTPCDDGRYCTENDACDGEGNCLGADRDCSDEGDACNDGVCDEDADACAKQPLADGTACQDGQYCTVDDTCQSGSCTAGPSRDCSWAATNQCEEGVCREFQNRCQPADKPAGESCDDGVACTSPDECDGNGNCVGAPDDSYCVAGYCRPECSTSPDGCMLPPTLTVDCPDTPVAVDQPATCTVTAQDLTGQENCITCVPHLLHLDMSLVDFSPNCDTQGWQLESSQLCQDPLVLPTCPLDSTLDTGPAPCCDNLVCPTQTWHEEVEALEAKLADCSDKEWRLSRVFDFRGFDQGRVCYDFGGVNTGAADLIQLQADPQDESRRVVIRCRTGAIPSGAMMVDCHDLPAAVFGWAQTRLTVWMHSNTAAHAWFLDNLWVTAQYAGCTPTTVVAFSEDFEGCPATIADGFNGWSVVQGSPRCLATACGSDGLEALPADGAWSIEHTVDTSALSGAVYLCWVEGDESGSIADFHVEFDAGTEWKPVYRNQDNQIFGATCAQNCRELTAVDPAAAQNPALKIRFSLEATNNAVMLDDISVSGPKRCDAAGTVQSGAVTPSASDYDINVTNSGGTPCLVQLECDWGGVDPPVTASDSFRFTLP
jgi:hypothetical protein